MVCWNSDCKEPLAGGFQQFLAKEGYIVFYGQEEWLAEAEF